MVVSYRAICNIAVSDCAICKIAVSYCALCKIAVCYCAICEITACHRAIYKIENFYRAIFTVLTSHPAIPTIKTTHCEVCKGVQEKWNVGPGTTTWNLDWGLSKYSSFCYIIITKLGLVYCTEQLRKKCPKTKFFLVHMFLYSDWIQENRDLENLRISTLFTQWT